MKKLLILMAIVSFLLMAGIADAADVTLRWDRNNETDLAGYKLYKTLTPGGYGWTPAVGVAGPSSITDGYLEAIIPVTVVASIDSTEHPNEFTILNIDDGDWYFVVTAFDTPIDVGGGAEVTILAIAGKYNESGFSNEPDQRIDTTPPAPPQNLSIWQIIIAWLKSLFGLA